MRRVTLAHRVERRVGRRVLKVTLRRLVHVFLARVRREPLRSTLLLGLGGMIGGALGATAGLVAGRKIAQSSSS